MRTTWTPELNNDLLYLGGIRDSLKNSWDSVAFCFNNWNNTTLNGQACKQRYNSLIRKQNATRNS